MRELDREKQKLEVQQNKLQREIKQNAAKGQMNAAKVQAKDLARTRKYIDRFNQTTVQLKAISLRIQVCRFNSTHTLALTHAFVFSLRLSRRYWYD
jgi:charged multivesicular body protein 2A